MSETGKIIGLDEQNQEQINDWDMPQWEHDQSELSKTNALGWVLADDASFQPPPKKIEKVEPITPEELKEIKKAGYAQGFKQGKESGIEKGIELGQQEGEKKGYEVGLQKGIEEGLRQGQEQVAQRCQMWESITAKLEQPLRNVDRQVERQLVQLAMELARQIILVEVTTSEETLYAVLREGIRHLPISSHGIDIRLNPQDAQWFHERYSQAECEKRNWHLKEDIEVPRGDIHLISDMSSLHLDLQQRIESMMHNFMRNNLSYIKENKTSNLESEATDAAQTTENQDNPESIHDDEQPPLVDESDE